MAKNYPEQLGEWVRQRESTQRDKNLVAFLAVQGDVKAALDAGYAVKTIWANMHELGRVKFGYDTFLNYVNRLVRRQQAEKATAMAEPGATAVTNHQTRNSHSKRLESSAVTPPAATGFTFNPSPDKEDLF